MASVNLIPSRFESSFYRRKNDEMVEMQGVPCRVYKTSLTTNGVVYDDFDEPNVIDTDNSKAYINSNVVLIYQKPKAIIGVNKGQDLDKELPYRGIFRFTDDIRRYDILDVAYEYARNAGFRDLVAKQPLTVATLRFKIVDRYTKGINSDLMNEYYLAPTEENWKTTIE